MQPTGRASRLRTGPIDLAVRQVGDPDAPAAVFAHGVGSSARFVVEAFGAPAVRAGYRLVAYDLRGHGASGPARDPAEHRLADHVADLAAVAATVGARLLGGVSLGAHVAIALAAEPATAERSRREVGTTRSGRGVEGLVACLPAWSGSARPGQGPHAAVAEEIRAVGVAGALNRATADPAVAGWLRDLLRRDWSAADPASLEAALLALDGGTAPDRGVLASVDVPAGVVGWPDDPGHPLSVARDWQRWLPRAALEVVTMAAVGGRPATLGEAAFRALAAA